MRGQHFRVRFGIRSLEESSFSLISSHWRLSIWSWGCWSYRLITGHDSTPRQDFTTTGTGTHVTVITYNRPAVSPAVRVSQTASVGLPRRNLRVLIVDDNRDYVLSTSMVLREDGHDTMPCYHAGAVTEALKRYDPHVVLLDIALPGKSGWEVARDIRANCRSKRPMLIGITGEYTTGADRVLGEMAGMDFYLLKPVDPKVLLTLLAKAQLPSDPA